MAQKKKFQSNQHRLIDVTIANKEALGQMNHFIKSNNITDVIDKQLRYVILKSGKLLRAIATITYNK